ncbi:hypothetical protein [Nostoc sp.]|uniref:hypothetical protein n=1 Tax=Nostoc sp. TaxID=1180 RepID=UPI002FFB9337
MTFQLIAEEQQILELLPEDVRPGVIESFKKRYDIAQQAIAEAAGTRSIKESMNVNPHDYVTAVLKITPTLGTKLDLIALAVHSIKPDSLEEGKKKYGDDFSKFSGIQFMQAIAATGISTWKSQRDVQGKMLNELKTLCPDEIVAEVEPEQEITTSTLSPLPMYIIEDSVFFNENQI